MHHADVPLYRFVMLVSWSLIGSPGHVAVIISKDNRSMLADFDSIGGPVYYSWPTMIYTVASAVYTYNVVPTCIEGLS